MPAYKPKEYLVTVHVEPTARNGLTKAFTGRVGWASTLAECRALVAKDKVDMADTFGGLIDAPGVRGRTYQVFHAQWTEIEGLGL